MKAFLPASAALALTTAALSAQEQERTVQLTVVSTSGDSVYLDHGRDVGLVVGTIVHLLPAGAARIDAEIRSVSNTSARAEIPPGLPVPLVGTPGEATVRVDHEAPARPPRAVRTTPEHPPWERSISERGEDQPLLVPTYGQHPADRPATLHGLVFGTGQWTHDAGGSTTSDYALARLGVRADGKNWLGKADRIRIAGEFDVRRTMLPDADDTGSEQARLDLLSIAFGTEEWSPVGIEVGRFYSPHLPEIGLVDGVEAVARFDGGIRAGAGFGSYPRPFPARDTGEDTGVHAFLDYTADPRRSLAAGVGLQKTWHRGIPDRDLLLLRAEGRPSDSLSIYGSAKIDFYSGHDTVKTNDIELTEAMGSIRWHTTKVGTGLMASHFSWPELRRAEYQVLPDDLVRDGHVERLSWNGWWRADDDVRLRCRVDGWQDDTRNGTSLGLDADFLDLLGNGSSLLVSAFRADGGYSSGPGARLLWRCPCSWGSWRAGYRWHRYELSGLVSGSESYTRQSAELGASCRVGSSTDLDTQLDYRFGDREDAWTFGLYVQWRF